MTPANIVNMAVLLGYDIIALTDHNSCLNAPAAVRLGQKNGLLVLPGMELCTREEIHVVCLLPNTEAAMDFHQYVGKRCSPVRNRPEIFGRQLIVDEEEHLLGEEGTLLLNAADIGLKEAACAVREFGGVAFPAHIDRNAYSVISVLGTIPKEIGFTAAELSLAGDANRFLAKYPELAGMLLLRDSDAHSLDRMPDPSAWIDLPEKTPECLISVLRGEQTARWGLS